MKVKHLESGKEFVAEKLEDGTYKIGEDIKTAAEMKVEYSRVRDEVAAPTAKAKPATQISIASEPIEVNGSEEAMVAMFTALSEMQGKLELGTKDKSGYGYKYMPLPQVIEIGKKPLEEFGLALLQFPSSYIVEGVKIVRVTTLITHKNGGSIKSSFDSIVTESKKNALIQTMGSLVTYISRYSRTNILGIAADDDKDGADTEDI